MQFLRGELEKIDKSMITRLKLNGSAVFDYTLVSDGRPDNRDTFVVRYICAEATSFDDALSRIKSRDQGVMVGVIDGEKLDELDDEDTAGFQDLVNEIIIEDLKRMTGDHANHENCDHTTPIVMGPFDPDDWSPSQN